jgi:hypothetical protein
MLEKYGVEHNSQSEEVKKKIKETCLEKYGSESALQNEDVKKKIIKTEVCMIHTIVMMKSGDKPIEVRKDFKS